MASPSVAEALVQMVRQRVIFINAQVAAGIPKEVLLSEQAHALQVAVKATANVTVEVATQVSQEVAAGPWTAEQKVMLASALRSAMELSKSGKSSGVVRVQQYCDSIHNFLTASDWNAIQNPDLTVPPKLQVLAQRMYRLGLVCPGNGSLKRAFGIILDVGVPTGTTMSADEMKNHMGKIRSMIKGLDNSARWPFDHIKRYPDTPTSLPPSVLDFAYHDGPAVEPPDVVTKQSMDMHDENLGYRGSHNSIKALKGGGHAAGQLVPAYSRSSSSGGLAPQGFDMESMMSGFMQMARM
eukprot:3071819-Pyramimonas_sp.AAC.1